MRVAAIYVREHLRETMRWVGEQLTPEQTEWWNVFQPPSEAAMLEVLEGGALGSGT